jgi:hypothetical protein
MAPYRPLTPLSGIKDVSMEAPEQDNDRIFG